MFYVEEFSAQRIQVLRKLFSHPPPNKLCAYINTDGMTTSPRSENYKTPKIIRKPKTKYRNGKYLPQYKFEAVAGENVKIIFGGYPKNVFVFS